MIRPELSVCFLIYKEIHDFIICVFLESLEVLEDVKIAIFQLSVSHKRQGLGIRNPYRDCSGCIQRIQICNKKGVTL